MLRRAQRTHPQSELLHVGLVLVREVGQAGVHVPGPLPELRRQAPPPLPLLRRAGGGAGAAGALQQLLQLRGGRVERLQGTRGSARRQMCRVGGCG